MFHQLYPLIIEKIPAILLFVWFSFRRPPAWLNVLVIRLSLSPAAVLICGAILLSLTATVMSVVYDQLGQANFLPVLVTWAAAGLTYLAAFAVGRQFAGDWREWLRAHRQELIAVGLVAAGAAVVRFYQLGAIPRVINGDEGLLGQAALGTDQLPLANPFSLFENFGGVYMQAMALSLRALGRTPFALRLAPAIGGTLAIPALYLLARQLFGARVALWAALLLAASHAHLHFSRTVAVGYIQGTFITPLVLYFVHSGLERRSALRLAAGGIALGMYFSVYLGAQILTAFLLIYLLVAAVLCRPLIQHAGWRRIAAFWFGAALMALPQAVFSVRQPDEFAARLNADGTFQSGWLAAEMARTGQAAARILFDRVIHAFLSLIYYPAQDFYGATVPLLGLITGALFLFGLAYSLWRTRDHRSLLLNGYFWSATVAVGLFAVPASADSYRMLVALPAAILLAAVGLAQWLALLGLASDSTRLARLGLSAALVAAVALLNLRVYFVDFAGRCRYGGDPQTRFASYFGNYLRTLDRETDVFLLSNSELRYGTHGSVGFLSGGLPVTNVDEPASELAVTANSAVIAIAERAEELRAWARAHPGGALLGEYDCDNLMLLAYRIP